MFRNTKMKLDFRKRLFYGERVKLILQGPGDTLYMPHAVFHLVHNLDTNLALTENLLFESAMEEFAVNDDVVTKMKMEFYFFDVYWSNISKGDANSLDKETF
jgi:hypothetical protein